MVWFWAVTGSVGALAAAGLWWSWRGRRVGEALYCRACGFDLTGTPGAGEPGNARCPECGRGVSRASAVRRGQRRRRPALGAASVTVLLIAVGLAGMRVWATTSYATFVAYAPTPMLMWVYQGDDVARGELIVRLAAGSLSQSVVDAIVAHALAMQANRAVPWDSAWGEAIEKAWEVGQLSQADMEAYLVGGVSAEIRARPRTQVGREPDVYAWWDEMRYGAFDAKVGLTWQSMAIDGEPVEQALPRSPSSRGGRPDASYEVKGGRQRGGSSTHVNPSPLGQALGEFTIEGELTATVTQTGPIPPMNPSSPWQPMMATGRVTPTPVTVEIVAESTGNYDVSEATTQAVRDSLHVWRDREIKEDGEVIERLRLAMVGEVADRLRLWAWSGDRWHDLTWKSDHGSSGDQWVMHSYRLDRIEREMGELPGRLTLLMRTNVESAETTTNLQRVWWRGEAWLADVPLDVEPLDRDTFSRMWSSDFVAPPSLVEPVVRSLTLAEVEGEPTWPPPMITDRVDEAD